MPAPYDYSSITGYGRTRGDWQDYPNTSTPITRTQLNQVDQAVYDLKRVVFNAKDYGAVGDGVADDTTKIQAAVTAAQAANGVALLPPGTYKVTSQLVVQGCKLVGGDVEPRTSTTGTVLNITDTTNPAVSLQQGGAIEGITFYYPNQVTTSTPTVYPATILCDQNPTNSNAQASLVTIRRCRFINSYIAIDTNVVTRNPFIRIEDNDFCALSIGIKHPYSAIETHIRGNRFTPAFWDASTGQAIRTTMSANAVAIQLGNGSSLASGTWIVGNTVFGYNKAVYFAGDANITTISDNMFDGCCFAIDFSGVATQVGEVTISGGVIGAVDPWTSTRRGYAIGASTSASIGGSLITISGVTFGPSAGDQVKFTWANTNAQIAVTGCTFGAGRYNDTSTASYGVFVSSGGCHVSVNGNTFADMNNTSSGKMVGVSLTTLAASVVGNTFRFMDKSVDVSGMATNTRPVTVVGNTAFQTTTRDLTYSSTRGIARIGLNRWARGQGGADEAAAGGYQVASAATVTLPDSEDFITVTGTTTITSVAASWPGRIVTLLFAGILTFTDGSNLKLNGNFVTTADDTITLACDGTNWFEIARSVN